MGSRRRVGNAHVDFGGQLQEAFEPAGGMIWPLPFVTVGQQQHQRRGLVPLGKAGDDKLVDDRLGRVDKVAILGFPEHQPLRALDIVAIFKANRGGFTQGAVVNFKGRFRLWNMMQWRVGFPRFGIKEDSMAMAKGATQHIFAGHADRRAFGQDRAKGERFGGGPVDAGFVRVIECGFGAATDAL